MTPTAAPSPSPRSEVDLFSDAVLKDPYPHYRALREIGPTVYLAQHEVWALTTHAAVHAALSDWRTFSSTDGIALNATTNRSTDNSPLAADPPAHRTPRKILATHLSPMAIRQEAPIVQAYADRLCADVIHRGHFDVVDDLTRPFVLSVLADHIGVPHDEHRQVAELADAAFDIMGPENPRTQSARVEAGVLGIRVLAAANPDRLAEGGAGRTLYAAGKRGDITIDEAAHLVALYLLASISTSTSAISSAVWLFAHHPEQWHALRANPQLMPRAVEEVLRFEAPVRGFGRVLRSSYDIAEVTIPAGARVMLLFASANRDETIWNQAEAFDITRDESASHLSFSHGLHSCSGHNLARLQVSAVLTALTQQVEHWEPGDARWKSNNIIRGLDSFQVSVNYKGRPTALAAPRIMRGSSATQVTNWVVTGTIGLAKLRQSVPLPPGATFTGALNLVASTMSGAMHLPRLTTGFKVCGINVGSTSQLIPIGAFDGDISISPDGSIDIRATSRAHLQIHALHVGRLKIPTQCRTVSPIEMPLYSKGNIGLTFRPSFSGTVTIPRIRGGLIGRILSLIVSGPHNPFAIELALPIPDVLDHEMPAPVGPDSSDPDRHETQEAPC